MSTHEIVPDDVDAAELRKRVYQKAEKVTLRCGECTSARVKNRPGPCDHDYYCHNCLAKLPNDEVDRV